MVWYGRAQTNQPARSLGESDDLKNQEDGKNSLKGERKSVLERGRVGGRAKVCPVGWTENRNTLCQLKEAAMDI